MGLWVHVLQVECSSLTGESDLVPATVDRKHDIPAEARNLVFMSSLAMNGEGRGIVIRTGVIVVLYSRWGLSA
jgi:magnesium-transporting ATPase (P-type)